MVEFLRNLWVTTCAVKRHAGIPLIFGALHLPDEIRFSHAGGARRRGTPQPPEVGIIAACRTTFWATRSARCAIPLCAPGTYDQKHIDRVGKLKDCIAYGPGILDLAHKPDEYVLIDDMVTSAKVMALAAWSLLHATA